jgi:hypothetical protein
VAAMRGLGKMIDKNKLKRAIDILDSLDLEEGEQEWVAAFYVAICATHKRLLTYDERREFTAIMGKMLGRDPGVLNPALRPN